MIIKVMIYIQSNRFPTELFTIIVIVIIIITIIIIIIFITIIIIIIIQYSVFSMFIDCTLSVQNHIRYEIITNNQHKKEHTTAI